MPGSKSSLEVKVFWRLKMMDGEKAESRLIWTGETGGLEGAMDRERESLNVPDICCVATVWLSSK